jgi:hypothetical protein
MVKVFIKLTTWAGLGTFLAIFSNTLPVALLYSGLAVCVEAGDQGRQFFFAQTFF